MRAKKVNRTSKCEQKSKPHFQVRAKNIKMTIQTTSFTRRRLPHWRVLGKSYFVTFRLKNTIPENVVKELKAERVKLEKSKANQEKIDRFVRSEFIKIESILDNLNNDFCYLKNPEIASLIIDTFNFIEKKFFWAFPCLTIMPNHVHCFAIKQPDANVSLETALGSLKQHVSREANKILGIKGRRWCDENFDHWCRTPESGDKIIKYIINNPVKAGLVNDWRDWKWTKICSDLKTECPALLG